MEDAVAAMGEGGGAGGSKEGQLSYEFTGGVVPKKGGWLRTHDAEQYESLEGRVKRLKQIIGKEAVPDSDSLAAATLSLHKRLDVLGQAFDDAAAEQLRASVQLLSCDIEVAVAEAEHLDRLEEEDRQADIGGDDLLEDMPKERIQSLHFEAKSLDSIAKKIVDVDRQLAGKDNVFREFARFSHDLQAAEQRLAYAKTCLKRTKEGADKMRESLASNKEEILKNVALLEKKIAE